MSEVQRILSEQSQHPQGSSEWFKLHAAYWRATARDYRREGFLNAAQLWDEQATLADQERFH